MPEVEVTVGGRPFRVACQEGEEHFLRAAAAMLNAEAEALQTQLGRLPETRMLLMAGLMLADKTAGLEDRVRDAEARIAELQSRLTEAASVAPLAPLRIEVPVVPAHVTDTLSEIAARAEALASMVEDRLA